VNGQGTSDRWGEDGFFFSEAGRGGPLTWRPGDVGFRGDALGPVRHAHDDAAEYYYLVQGSIRVEVGGREFVVGQGELCYIPPDAPHNVLGPASDVEARMLCVIAPNFADNKWRIDGFKRGSEQLPHAVARPFADAELPGDEHVAAEAVELAAGAAPLAVEPSGRECVYLVLDGTLEIALDGGLRGAIEPGTYVHVREAMRHELASASGCRLLRLDLTFVPWTGVVVPSEAVA